MGMQDSTWGNLQEVVEKGRTATLAGNRTYLGCETQRGKVGYDAKHFQIS